MGKPYVISAELDLAAGEMDQIVNKKELENFRENLDTDLRAMGKETLWVPSSILKNGLEDAAATTNLPAVSLDDRYVSMADQFIGISRGVDPALNDAGYVPRRGYAPVCKQLAKVASLGNEILLIDDVLFSGEMVTWLSESLRPYGVKIGALAVGIAIGEGAEKLAAAGIDVVASEMFDDVDDEICERDFAIVAGSGRRVDALKANALYFDAVFGKPEQWASITPGYESSFCVNSLKRSAALLQPGIPMQRLGKFVGYGDSGEAARQIAQRLETAA